MDAVKLSEASEIYSIQAQSGKLAFKDWKTSSMVVHKTLGAKYIDANLKCSQRIGQRILRRTTGYKIPRMGAPNPWKRYRFSQVYSLLLLSSYALSVALVSRGTLWNMTLQQHLYRAAAKSFAGSDTRCLTAVCMEGLKGYARSGLGIQI